MADIYFTYSPMDKDRQQSVRAALQREGFDIADEDAAPKGSDLMDQLRYHVSKSRCVVAVWSENALADYEMLRVARLAGAVGKLVSVLIDDLPRSRLATALVPHHSARLIEWSGDTADSEWAKFLQEVESKIPSIWTLRRWGARERELQAALQAEREKREVAEALLAVARARLQGSQLPTEPASQALAATAVPVVGQPALSHQPELSQTTMPLPAARLARPEAERIFISYASVDRSVAAELAKRLNAEGYSVWWDTQLIGGEQYRKTIIEKLATSKASLVIWTAASVESDWVYDEATRARKLGRLIPLRLPDFDPDAIPPPFGALHTLVCDDFRGILLGLLRHGLTPNRPAEVAA